MCVCWHSRPRGHQCLWLWHYIRSWPNPRWRESIAVSLALLHNVPLHVILWSDILYSVALRSGTPEAYGKDTYVISVSSWQRTSGWKLLPLSIYQQLCIANQVKSPYQYLKRIFLEQVTLYWAYLFSKLFSGKQVSGICIPALAHDK